MNGIATLNRKMTKFYYGIINSIAFYPIIITFCYLVLITGMLQFDYSEVARELSKEMWWLQFKEMDAVRSIMTTLIAGIISLMALSFSMVMVVLNQATTTVSPKVMQGLITKKEHQFVLGNQFGAILYFIVLLLLLRGLDFYHIPTFSVTLGLLIGFWSMCLFVYFIHSISQSIQVTNIITSIHDKTLKVLQQLKKKAALKSGIPKPIQAPIEPGETPYEYLTDKPGFFQELNQNALLKLAQKYDLKIRMEPTYTDFVASGSTLFWCNVPPEKLQEKERQQLYNCILFFNQEIIGVNHVYGITQLGEIAIKSLSPGINDPGIAVMCVHYLADLFVNLYSLQEEELFTDEAQITRLEVKNISFQNLLTSTISPIRFYGKNNESVVRALLGMLTDIAKTDLQQRKYRVLLNQHAEAVLTCINEALIVPADAINLTKQVMRMQALKPGYFTFRSPDFFKLNHGCEM